MAMVTGHAFHKTSGWLDFYDRPTRPLFRLPAGAVDAHCHVFGPGDTFPYAEERKYTPCDAPKEALFALRDYLGFEKNVIVQASCHGTDNRALLDALHAAGGRARGIAVVAPDITDTELHTLDAAGVRGVRFTFLKRLVDDVPQRVLTRTAARVAELGWHIVVYLETRFLSGLRPFLDSLDVAVILDHMGRPDVTQPVDGPEFGAVLSLLRERPNTWIKVSGSERLTQSGPWALDGERRPYRDVVPFARRLVEGFPDRVLWGTDWPHPNLKSHMPDDGLLVDNILQIAPDPELRRKLLVDNPTRLYWG